MIYVPRKDFVLLRTKPKGVTKAGLTFPDQAGESRDWFVERCGPEVTDLKVGDKVMVTGTFGVDVAQVLGETSLFITKANNILLTIEGD